MPRDSMASSKHTDPADDLLDKYSPLRVAKIFPTNYKRKPLVIASYRPKENQCLDYYLSETNVRWNIGDTKVRAKQIIADYVLAPPGYIAKKKPVYGSGGPPCWKWLDEIWRENIERRQARYKEMFAEYVKNRRTKVIKDKSNMFNFKFKLDCPLWYQELSFRQMAVVENLQWCINTDLQYNIIDNTKENLARLGLMLRANSKGIKIALKYCCGSDVEFLLVLYQISNPNRTDYSINDRLLLSAVYHLCITETLRELHVRIPSPPREGKKKIMPELPKRPKKQKFDSPYLEPFTYVRPPPKNTGIYKKNLIQYPESPYFFYLADLYEEIENSEDPRDIDISEIEDPVILEIIEEMKKAQVMYSRLPHKTYRNIVAPTVKDRCKDIDEFLRRSKKSVMPSEPEPTEPCLPPLAELPADEEEPCICDEPGAGEKSDDQEPSEPDEIEPICLPQNIPCGECPEEECDCKSLALTHMKSFCKRCIMKKRYKQRIVMNGCRCMEDGTVVPIIGGFYKEKECLCLQRYQSRWQILDKAQKMETEKVKFSISGICYTPAGAFFIVQSVVPLDGRKRGTDDDLKPCSQAICICEELERMRPKTLVEVPIPELRPSPVMPWELTHCTCKEELNKFLSLQCHCPDCEEQQRLANPDMILGGTKQIICKDSGGGMGEYAVSIPIVQGVQELHCECLEKYKEHLKKLEEYKQRVKARIVLKAREHKYAIGGVTQTKDGPVYQIQGLRTPLKCICEEVDAEMREEEAQRNRMPKMPPTGRAKYAIGGVYAGTCAADAGVPEGENLFILTSALGDKPCKCHKLYEVFEEEHKNCMDYFEEYMKKTMDDILAVKMEEAKKREKQRKKEAKLKALEPQPPPEPEEPPDYCLDPCPACQPVCPCIEKPDNFDNISSFRRESDESTGSDLFSVGSNTCTCAIEKADEERLKKMVPCEPCNEELPPEPCPPETAPEPTTPKLDEPEDNEVYDLKRYVILEKIPCDEKEMLEIVIKVLATMADDGFPLAKLPECHKLPIFKLWIYLRCGKCWKWEERPPFNVLNTIITKKSKNIGLIPLPTIPIGVRKANKLTWKDATYVKAMMEDLKDGFYRKVKQSQIEGMRAFFPAIFNYEFPEQRHTFFCYLPSKEEDFCFKSQ